uniref:Uncharacterized protein n=1 Tax=Ascaris lumbricoides TaxID=6252 RepID=A0A0M3HRD4_ASCLU
MCLFEEMLRSTQPSFGWARISSNIFDCPSHAFMPIKRKPDANEEGGDVKSNASI